MSWLNPNKPNYTKRVAPGTGCPPWRLWFSCVVLAVTTQSAYTAAHQENPPVSALPTAAVTTPALNQVVFVDSGVENGSAIIDDLAAGAEVIYLNKDEEGLIQVADALKNRSNIAAIHIFSHGDIGKVQLGNTWVDSSYLKNNTRLLETIGSSLGAGGDILLYGCNVAGNQNNAFIDDLARLTGADVAASANVTGSARLGGDWVLEAHTGEIGTPSLLLANYQGILALPADNTYKFADATDQGNGTYLAVDGFFVLSAEDGNGGDNPVSADEYGAFIDENQSNTSGTSYIQIHVAGGGSFRLNSAVIGDYYPNGVPDGAGTTQTNFFDVYVVGYASGVPVAETPKHSSINTYQTDYQLDFSSFSGITIDTIRVYYSWSSGLTQQNYFNLLSLTIAGASNDPADPPAGTSNQPPTLSAVGQNPEFQENASTPADLFRNVAISAVEGDQNIDQITLTVAGLANGIEEILRVDGSNVALTQGNSVITGGLGLSVTVSVSVATATVTLAKTGGITAAQAQTVVDGLGYRNTADISADSTRTVTLTGIRDTGGTADGGVDSTVLSIASTVTLKYDDGLSPGELINVLPTHTLLNFINGFTLATSSALGPGNDPLGIWLAASGGTSGWFEVSADNVDIQSFDLTALKLAKYAAPGAFSIIVTGIKSGGGPNVTTNITSADGTTSFTSGDFSSFTGLSKFRIDITANGPDNQDISFITFDSFHISEVVVPILALTSATYNASTGALVVTGTKFTASAGDDVIANKFTFTGEGGSAYTLVDTANVEITNATSFTLTLGAIDRAAVNQIINKNGTNSTGGTLYNLAGAAGFIADSAATADGTNGITVSNVAVPAIASATYDANTGVLVVTGTDLKKLNGASNDIVANKFTLRGEGSSTWTLTDTADVEITSGTSFTLTLSATDKATVNLILNKNGTSAPDATTYNLAAAEDWAAGADAALAIADTTNGVTVSNVNVTPVIANLNGDIVSWPGVGNSVTLDFGGDATVADTELDAGNWNGASLTVQRAITPLIAADVFSFNAVGYSVNGGNLQTGGSTTFGTFTNTNGLLTISFNANATNTLVRDVVRSIQYRNDTPAGDATIRFTLSDGNSSTTADVKVSSDVIYVTNATDTATINVADGVSFSEAIAIAAADVTGGQTLVFTGATAFTINNVSIGESLTFNMDSASGMSLTGGAITLTSGSLTLANGEGDSATIASVITGAGAVTKAGAGALSLEGSNGYAGTTVSAGILSIGNDGNLGFGALTLATGTTLAVTGSTNIDNAITLSGNATVHAANTLTLSGVISGGGGITKEGAGTLTLDNGNNYSGSTTVSAGALSITGDSNLGSGAVVLAAGSTLSVTGPGTIDNAITLTGAATISNAVNVTIDGVISGAHNLTKAGAGTLTLAGNNTYSGTTVSAGTLSIANDDYLGTGAVTLAAGTTLAVTGATTIDNAIVLDGSATISNSADATLSSVISGAGNLTKAGASTLTLSGSNTYGGSTTVSTGGLTLSGGASISDSSAVTVASGSTLTLALGTETIGSLAGAGNVVLSYNLITGSDNSSTAFSGAISSTNTSGIVKTGSGTFTLSGTNTYTGSTTVSSGTLTLNGGAAIADASAVTVASGATLSLGASETLGSLAGAGNISLSGFTLSSGGNNANTTFSGVLGGSGGFTKTGSGTLTLSGSNSGSFSGGITVSGGGTLSVANDDNLGSGILSINNSVLNITGAAIAIDNDITLTNSATVNNPAAVTLAGAINGSGNFTKTGSGALTLPGTNTYGGATSVAAGTLAVDGALNGTSSVSVASGATITGSGIVTSLAVNSGGTLSPGNSPGVFTVNGNLQMNPGSTLAIEINGATAGTGYDQVIVLGDVNVNGAALSVTHGYTPGNGDSYTIIDNDSFEVMTGIFSGLASGDTVIAGGNGTELTANYLGGDGNDFTLTAPINAAPVIANLNGNNVNFIEDSAQVLLDADSDATVTDSDSADFDGGNVTVSIVANRVDTEDILSIRNQGTSGGQIGTSGLNITYGGTIIGTRTANGGTDVHDLVITLNSAATPEIVEVLVHNLTYINTNTTTPDTTDRTVRVTINDGDGGTSGNADITVAVTDVNDAPTLTATGGTPTFTEGGSPVSLFSAVNISAVEPDQLIQTLVFTITNVTNGSSEIIYFDGSNIPLTDGFTVTTPDHGLDASVAVTGTTATLTLTRAGGLSVMQTLVGAMTYSNSSINPGVANRVVTIASLQDTGGTANGGEDTAAIGVSAIVAISAINSAPVVTTTAGVTAFTEGNNVVSTPVVIDAGITVSDVDNAALVSATVSITGNFQTLEDVLEFTNDSATMGDVDASYDAVTGVLTLTSSSATATLTEWQNALAAVAYTNNSDTPNTATRQLSFAVNDGVDTSIASTKDVTITAVNDTPLIFGSPALSINRNTAYSFIPNVTDVDSAVFTFTITNKPTWAGFNTNTGALTGTPTNADVGTTTGIVISVSDGATSTSLPAFNLAVVNTNDAPVISGTPATQANAGSSYSFTPTATDADATDVLTFSISNKPSWAGFNPATGALTGTPAHTDAGETVGIVISVSDGSLSASLPAFTLTVVSSNRAPVISGSPLLEVKAGSSYSFTPTASDSDGDALTFSIANKPVWAGFDTATGSLSGVPAEEDIGNYGGIVISVSDGITSAALPAFTLSVTAAVDPLAPVVAAPADILLNATALYTPVSLRQLLGLAPSVSQEEIDQVLASLAGDATDGNSCCTTHPEGLNANNILLLPPGRHEIVWKATNAAGLTGFDTQIINLRPLVSFSKHQVAVRGSEVEVRVILNGPSPVYPLDIPYEIDDASSALPDEHSLTTGLASFTEPGQREVVIPVQLHAITGAGDSELVLRLDDQSPAGAPATTDLFDINAGATNRHVISIREGNVAPSVSLQLVQGGINTSLITPTGGVVTATAVVVDPNPDDSHSFDWSASDTVLGDTDGDVTDATRVFSPAGLNGRHQLQVSVSDSAGATGSTRLHFRVVNEWPVLDENVDTDGDGIDDLTEGFGDNNGNGIPNYLDNMPSDNVLPQVVTVTDSYLIECDPGVRCRIGPFALMGSSGGVQILDEEVVLQEDLAVDDTHTPVGGIFDFEIRDLPTPGQSVRVVIPQQAAIPAHAVYRKFQSGQWVNFIENANNALHSAPGNPGYCPPPGAEDWQPGLIEGHLCVQLTLEDGGPNDADGEVNAAVVDPGAVSSVKPVIPPTEPTPAPVQVKSKGGGALSVLWSLFLGVIGMLKAIRRGRLAALLIGLIAVNAQAGPGNSQEDSYVRIAVYTVQATQSESRFSSALANAGYNFTVNRYDENRHGYQLAFGYQWNSFTYTELGYLDLGKVKVDLTIDGDTDFGAFAADFARQYPLTAEGASLVQGVSLDLGNQITVSAEGGAFIWKGKVQLHNAAFATKSNDGIDPILGLRLDVPVNETFGLGAAVHRIFFGDQKVDLYGVSARFHF